MRNRRLRDHLSESCDHKFKATNGWNNAAAAATSKKGLDETGLMAVTCFHGIGVCFVNLYAGNERHTHGERLLEVMHTDCPEATKMCVCYSHKGFGLMVGEEVEQLWSMLRRLIPCDHYSSGPRRKQKIDSCGLFLGPRQ
jgi:hypothetical protein